LLNFIENKYNLNFKILSENRIVLKNHLFSEKWSMNHFMTGFEKIVLYHAYCLSKAYHLP